jgi:hypothetical protein
MANWEKSQEKKQSLFAVPTPSGSGTPAYVRDTIGPPNPQLTAATTAAVRETDVLLTPPSGTSNFSLLVLPSPLYSRGADGRSNQRDLFHR